MSDPVRVEADGLTQSTIWEGIEVVVPSSVDEWDMDALEAFENAKGATFLVNLVGRSTYDEMCRAFIRNHGRKPKVSDFAVFTEQVAKLYGFGDAGE